MKHRAQLLLVILLLAGSIRAVVLWATSEAAFLEIDGGEYQDIARNLATGHGFSVSNYRWFEPRPAGAPEAHPDLYRPPLLPFLGAGLFLLPGAWLLWAKITALAIGWAGVLVVYLLARELLGRGSALLAAAIFSVYPFAIFYSSRWSTESLLLLTTLAGLFFLARARSGGRVLHLVLSGACLGLAGLARPQGLLMFLTAAILVVTWRSTRRAAAILAFVTGGVLVLAPWAVRNYHETGVANPATSFAAYNAWLGMNPRAHEMALAGESPRFKEALDTLYRVDSKRHVRALEERGITNPAGANRYWLDLTTRFAREHPEQATRILGHRTLHYFRPWPNRATTSPRVFWVALFSAGPLLILGAAAILTRPETRNAVLLVPAGVSLLGSLPFIFHLRFRFPVFDPCMVIIASSAALAILRYAVDGSRPSWRRASGGRQMPRSRPPET
jgi:4-amino-4-deoxy-L-arabinose transferase-like glycosyltransferase